MDMLLIVVFTSLCVYVCSGSLPFVLRIYMITASLVGFVLAVAVSSSCILCYNTPEEELEEGTTNLHTMLWCKQNLGKRFAMFHTRLGEARRVTGCFRRSHETPWASLCESHPLSLDPRWYYGPWGTHCLWIQRLRDAQTSHYIWRMWSCVDSRSIVLSSKNVGHLPLL